MDKVKRERESLKQKAEQLEGALRTEKDKGMVAMMAHVVAVIHKLRVTTDCQSPQQMFLTNRHRKPHLFSTASCFGRWVDTLQHV